MGRRKQLQVCGRCGRNETTEEQCEECQAFEPDNFQAFSAGWFDVLAEHPDGFIVFCKAMAKSIREKAYGKKRS